MVVIANVAQVYIAVETEVKTMSLSGPDVVCCTIAKHKGGPNFFCALLAVPMSHDEGGMKIASI